MCRCFISSPCHTAVPAQSVECRIKWHPEKDARVFIVIVLVLKRRRQVMCTMKSFFQLRDRIKSQIPPPLYFKLYIRPLLKYKHFSALSNFKILTVIYFIVHIQIWLVLKVLCWKVNLVLLEGNDEEFKLVRFMTKQLPSTQASILLDNQL